VNDAPTEAAKDLIERSGCHRIRVVPQLPDLLVALRRQVHEGPAGDHQTSLET